MGCCLFRITNATCRPRLALSRAYQSQTTTLAVFFNAANLGKRRGSRRLCLSFFQVAQVFFAFGQDITYLADNATSILLRDLQNRFQGF